MNGVQGASSPPHQRHIFLRTLINAPPLYYVREVQLFLSAASNVAYVRLEVISFLNRDCTTILLFFIIRLE